MPNSLLATPASTNFLVLTCFYLNNIAKPLLIKIKKLKEQFLDTYKRKNVATKNCKVSRSAEISMSKSDRFYTKSTSNTLLGIVSTVLAVGLTAIIMPIIVVRFGAENWARYAFFLLYVAVLSFVESTLQMYSLQRCATANSTANKYHWTKDKNVLSIFFGILLLGGLVIGVDNLYEITQDAILSNMLILAFINVFPRSVSSLIKGTMLGINSQVRYYATTTLLNLSRPMYLLLVLLIFQPSIVNLVMLYVIFSFAEMFAYILLYAAQRPVKSISSKIQKVDQNLLCLLLISSGISVIAINLDKILVFKFVNLTLASEYTFASSVAGLLYMFANVAITAYGPKIKELFLHEEKSAMRIHLYGISFVNNIIVMLAIAAFYFSGDYLLHTMSSSLDKNNVMNTFLLLATACLLSSNLWIPGIFATSMGHASFNVKTNLLFVVSYLIVFFVIEQQLGQYAFALSMLLAAAVTTTIGFFYFKFNIFQINIERYIVILIALPALIIGFLILPLWALDAYYKSLLVNIIYMLAISVLGVTLWFRAGDALKLRLRALLENL